MMILYQARTLEAFIKKCKEVGEKDVNLYLLERVGEYGVMARSESVGWMCLLSGATQLARFNPEFLIGDLILPYLQDFGLEVRLMEKPITSPRKIPEAEDDVRLLLTLASTRYDLEKNV